VLFHLQVCESYYISALAGVISPARAENLKWIKLLEDDEHKNIVIGSLQFLSDNKRVK